MFDQSFITNNDIFFSQLLLKRIIYYIILFTFVNVTFVNLIWQLSHIFKIIQNLYHFYRSIVLKYVWNYIYLNR